MQTGQQITDDIFNVLTKFGATQDQRYDKTWIAYKRDQIRVQLIELEFKQRFSTNPSWYQDLNLIQFTPVTASDIDYGICGSCPVSKAIVPETIPLFNPNAQNEEDSLRLISPCGTKQFYFKQLDVLKQIPSEHPFNKYCYYWKIGNQIFVNKYVNQLRGLAVLQNPSDAGSINNTIISSGSLIVGQTFQVINYQIVHNNLGYNPGQTFVAVNPNYTGNGAVILATVKLPYDDKTSNYPVSIDMARQITLEILTKEFGLEEKQISAFKNEYGETNSQITNKAAQV